MCEKSEYKIQIDKFFTIYCQLSGDSFQKSYIPHITLSKLETNNDKKTVVSNTIVSLS